MNDIPHGNGSPTPPPEGAPPPPGLPPLIDVNFTPNGAVLTIKVGPNWIGTLSYMVADPSNPANLAALIGALHQWQEKAAQMQAGIAPTSRIQTVAGAVGAALGSKVRRPS